jgi:hypothetical protein
MKTIRSALVVASLGVAGCVAGDPSETPPTGSVREQSIAPDFTFQTSQTVSVQIAPDDATFAATDDAPVEVRRPDGAVLFRGAVRKGAPLDVELSVPTAFDHVEVDVAGSSSRVELDGAEGGAGS